MKNERILYKTNRKSIYIWTICLLVLAFSVIACTNFISNTKIAHAEETETQQNQIVNFNQLWNPSTLRSSYSGITYTNNQGLIKLNGRNNNSYYNTTLPLSDTTISFLENHNYYIRYKFIKEETSTRYLGIVSSSGTLLYDLTNNLEGIYNSNSAQNVKAIFGVLNQTSYDCSFYLIIIDLTLMFGENTPTLEQCQSIFVADYYNYDIGSGIYLNNLDSYSRGYTAGFNSAWESQNITYKQFVIGAQSFAFNNQQYTEESTKSYDAIAGAYSFGGILGIPLGFTAVGGTNFEIDFYLLCTDWSQESLSYKQEFNLYFYYVNSDNYLVQIGKIPYYQIDGNYGTYKGSFNCPVDTDTIYLEFTIDPLDNISTIATAFTSNITFRSQNIESAINSAFNAGAESMKETYLPGGDLYNEIYRNAYDHGVMDANTNNSVFQDGWHFIASAFGSVGEILSVELIPGVQIGVFVALPVLLGLIVLIVKILGKGS